MEGFKKELKDIKQMAIDFTVEDSHKCWELFPRKNKQKYNSCAYDAVVSYHVYCQGKRMIQAAKKKFFDECDRIGEPNKIKECMERGYKDLTENLPSLKNWIDRERKNIDWEKY